MASYTSKSEVDTAISTLRTTFASNRTKDLRYRKWQLKQLYWLVADNTDAFIAALKADLNRPEFESRFTTKGLLEEIEYHIDSVESWAKDEVPNAGIIFSKLGKTTIRQEPRGVAFIIGAWNFPDSLTLHPLASAIAAGCCALVKPSEIAAHSAELMCRLAPKYLDSEAYAFVSGGAAETQYMLTHKFDHVFFTGSTPVAKHVAAATAKHLTPTVLELGGQGPAIVTKTANVDLAAKRIGAAKFMNAGQICLSVNHTFVHPDVHAKFLERIKYWNDTFSSNGQTDEMCTIVNERNAARLSGMLEKTNGTVVSSGKSKDDNPKKLFPTIVSNVKMNDSLLSEELFGPILPIIEADHITACKTVSSMPHPLAIYIFSTDQSEIDYILDHTLSGGVTINDTLLHAGAKEAPFGGVGDSGSGSYHGRYGFDTFTHKRTIVRLPDFLDIVMSFRYPPYNLAKAGLALKVGKPKFKRGEKLEDQRVGKGWSRLGLLSAVVGVVGVGLAAWSGKLGPLVGDW
ncbi:aldehyde dehydrogenase 3H1 [Setomelanomma holmii]|uniref:Aldehyde dehydrogenase n=1 Tax=Setomelanomma holmii TaxID=210430 RepID=A0A9P4LPI2_9PLEO|nr:aldehyde dehydrogenase 3H1 [Setomelanomma holmii]